MKLHLIKHISELDNGSAVITTETIYRFKFNQKPFSNKIF